MVETEGSCAANKIVATKRTMPSTTAVLTAPVELPPPSGLRSLTPTLVYDVTKSKDERRQTLHELLIKGHDSMAPLREPKLILHSHLPHV